MCSVGVPRPIFPSRLVLTRSTRAGYDPAPFFLGKLFSHRSRLMRRFAAVVLSLYALAQTGCGWCQRQHYNDTYQPNYYAAPATACAPVCVPCTPQVQVQSCPPGCAPIGTMQTTVGPTGR